MTKKGFSLIELVVAISVLSIITLVVYGFSTNIFSYSDFIGSAASSQQDAQKVVDKIVAELRTTSPSSAGDYPLAQTGTNNITFFANIDSDSYIEKIRYFINGTILKKGVTKPSGNPLSYDPGNETVSNSINGVLTSTSTIFYYYDGSATATSTPLATPVIANQVRLIKIDIWINSGSKKIPGSLEITSKVNLRNLKSN